MTLPQIELAPIPRVALSADNAAQALDVSRDHFDRHVAPNLRVVRTGRRKLYPVAELARWAEREAAMTLEDR
jgi:hypothetical protein